MRLQPVMRLIAIHRRRVENRRLGAQRRYDACTNTTQSYVRVCTFPGYQIISISNLPARRMDNIGMLMVSNVIPTLSHFRWCAEWFRKSWMGGVYCLNAPQSLTGVCVNAYKTLKSLPRCNRCCCREHSLISVSEVGIGSVLGDMFFFPTV